MRYHEIRDRLVSGDVVAFRADTIKSWIIRKATRSPYSHVGIVWVIAGRVLLLDAVIPKVRIFPLSKMLPFDWMPINRPMTMEQEELALSWVGEEYSVMEAMRGFFGFAREDNQRWQCAEYVKTVLGFNCQDTPQAVVNEALRLSYEIISVAE
jgi:hypothetical protein